MKYFIAILLNFLFISSAIAAQPLPGRFTDIVTGGPEIDVRVFANLSAAKSSSKTAGKTILITASQTINNLTLSADRHIKIVKDARITVNSGKILTINSTFEAPARQVFSGAGSIKFGAQSVERFLAAWWGTTATAINTAITAAYDSGGGIVDILPGVYDLQTTALSLKDKVWLRGLSSINYTSEATTANKSAVTLKYTGSGYAVSFGDGTYNCQGAMISGFEIYGAGTGANGIRVYGKSGGWSGGNTIQNVAINNFTGVGLEYTDFAFVSKVESVSIKNCGTGLKLINNANAMTFNDLDITQCVTAVDLSSTATTYGYGIRFNQPHIEGCTTGFNLNSTYFAGIDINSPYIESVASPVIFNASSMTLTGGVISGDGTNAIEIKSSGTVVAGGFYISGTFTNLINVSGSANPAMQILPFRNGAIFSNSVLLNSSAHQVIYYDSTFDAQYNRVLKTINMIETSGVYSWQNIGDANPWFELLPARKTIKLSNLPVYADNAAALAGGLTAGSLYRTSTGGVLAVY